MLWGYDVQPFSFFPNEEEILLEPETDFRVTGVVDTESLVRMQIGNASFPRCCLKSFFLLLILRHRSRPPPHCPILPLKHLLLQPEEHVSPLFMHHCPRLLAVLPASLIKKKATVNTTRTSR